MKSKTTHWNYRVIKAADKKIPKLPQTYYYGIHEVYYTDNKPTSWTEKSVYPFGDTFSELLADYHIMLGAFELPVLQLKGGKLKEIGMFK